MTKATRSFCHREEKSVIKFFYGTSQLSSGDASDSICPKGWGIAKATEDSSYHKLFRQSYLIKEFSTSKANTENELQKVKMPFLQRGFFDANLVGLFNNNSNSSIDNRERHTNFAIKTAESKTKIYSFALTSNPRISYKTGVQKSQGYSLHCVAKVFCFIKHFCYFSLSKPRE